ncbi:MAG: FecR domain-containing protein [Bacteroidota bacterium]
MNNNYLTYTIEQLAADESFINWIKTNDPELSDQWRTWLENNPKEAEKVAGARQLVESLVFERIDGRAIDKGALWDKIDQSIKPSPETEVKSGKMGLLKSALWAAAATLAFFLIFKPFAGKENTVVAMVGEHMETTLPDNSDVLLNADSEIGYYPKKWGKGRNVRLDGEAFFEVTKGTRFIVHTKLGTVEVLGTSFNVLSRGDRFEVFCKTGKVKVSSFNGRYNVVLTPGNAATLTPNKTFEKTKLGDDGPLGWKAGNFSFDGATLEVVFDEFERQYAVEIRSSESIDTMRYTGSFSRGDLRKALKDVTWPMGLETKTEGKNITVTKSSKLSD